MRATRILTMLALASLPIAAFAVEALAGGVDRSAMRIPKLRSASGLHS
jgi:hypothetical protein